MIGSVSISRKLRRLSLLGSGTALVAASLALLGVQVMEVRSILLTRLQTLADVLAFNSAAAVDFNDAEAATQMLSALKTRPEVVSAGIVSEDRVFARYVRPNAQLPAMEHLTSAAGHRFTPADLTVYRPVIVDGRTLGTLFVQADLREIGQTFRRFAGITAIVAVPALLIAVLISMVAQRAISKPILSLASLAETVWIRGDYSIRSAEHQGVAEVEQLSAAFNQMLAEIERQHDELSDAKATLEQRVKERTRELDATNKELESFSYSVSHDLRAPLRAIDGFSRVLLTDYGPSLDKQGVHYLERVRAGTQRMGSLIDDLLELSRVTRSNLTRRTIDVSVIAQSVADELARRHPDREVQCLIEPGLLAFADSRLMAIAFENLLGNAWKFTAHVPKARIEFGRASGDGEAVFCVRDNGAGFDMAYADKLFGAFQRLHSDSEFEGTGIGLATVQRIIHRHGGRIWAEAARDLGAQFYFTLGENLGYEDDSAR